MAASAAFLRSVARRIAGAPPPYPRPLLRARGLQSVARSGSGTGSILPPPPAAASLQPSLATKLARAPPPPPNRLLHERGLHSRTSPSSCASGSTPAPTSNKDLGARRSEFLRTLTQAKVRAGVAYITLFGSLIYMVGWVKPANEKLVDKVDALCIERLIQKEKVQAMEHKCQRLNVLAEEVLTDVFEAQSMQSSGHGKEVDGDGAPKKVHCRENRVKELEAGIKDLQADVTKLKIALEQPVMKRKS